MNGNSMSCITEAVCQLNLVYNISNDDDGLTLGEYAEYIASLANLKVRYEIENNESVSKATFALLDTHKIKNIGWKYGAHIFHTNNKRVYHYGLFDS